MLLFAPEPGRQLADVVAGLLDVQVADVGGRTAVLIDDMIATGTTLVRAAEACLEHGAARVVALATHGVFSGRAEHVLSSHALDRVVVTDTVGALRVRDPAVVTKTGVESVAPLLAEALAAPDHPVGRRR